MKERGKLIDKKIIDEELEKHIAEDIWLNYFNRYLFEYNLITEKEYKQMTKKIAVRKLGSSQNLNQPEYLSPKRVFKLLFGYIVNQLMITYVKRHFR